MAHRTRKRHRRKKRFGEVTKRDFVRIAEVLKKHGSCEVAIDLASYFSTQNPRFDSSRFLRATGCGR